MISYCNKLSSSSASVSSALQSADFLGTVNDLLVRSTCLIVLFMYMTSVRAQMGKALVLDGCTNYFEGVDDNLFEQNPVISIECWIQPNCDTENRVIFGKEFCLGQMGYYFAVNNGRLQWSFSGNGFCTNTSVYRSSSAVINAHEFTHVAVMHNQTEIKLFINGMEVTGSYTAGSFSGIHDGNAPFRIGVYQNISGNFQNYYSGLIDELRVWEIELTETLIQQRMNTALTGSEPGLVAYFDMEDSGVGSSLLLENKSSYGSQFDAFPIGTTTTTPYLIGYDQYDTLDVGLADTITICQFTGQIEIEDRQYKSILWNTGAMNASIDVNSSGLYWVEVETELCKKYRDTTIVNFEVIEAQEDFSICPGESIIIDGTTYETAGNFVDTIYDANNCDTILDFSITLIDTTQQNVLLVSCDGLPVEFNGEMLTVNSTTLYILTAVNGCDSNLTVSVINSDPVTGFLGEDANVCGDSYTITSEESNTEWPDGTTGSTYEVTTSGSYVGMYMDVNGCVQSDTIEVTFSDVVEEELELVSCDGLPVEFNGELLVVNSSRLFQLTSVNGCDSNLTVSVINSDPVTGFLGEDSNVCGDSYTITSEESNTEWPDGTTGSTYEVTTSGSYVGMYMDVNGCLQSDTVEVTFTDVVEEELELVSCDGLPVEYRGELLEVNSSTTFMIQNNAGCDSVIMVDVIESTPVYNFLGMDDTTCDASFIITSNAENTFWPDGSQSSTFEVTSSGSYIGFFIDDLGCTNADTINVGVLRGDQAVYMPSAFSPNGDGINDCFYPYFTTQEIPSYDLSIYNRWGDLIFTTSTEKRCWDGTFGNKLMSPQVFVWVLQWESETCDSKLEMSGSVNLIH